MAIFRRFNVKEERVMYILWKLKSAYVQDIVNEMSEASPHYNTISSTVRKLEKEGHIGHRTIGRSHKYYPISKRKAYRSVLFEHLSSSYFKSKERFLVYTFEKLGVSKSEVRSALAKYRKNR